MRDDDDDSGEFVAAPASSVYFQSPRHLGPGLDSFTPSGYPATPVLHISRHPASLPVAQSPLSLEGRDDGTDELKMPFPRDPAVEGGSKLVLLIGCGTFVGLHVATKLLASGYSVRMFMLDTASTEQLEVLQASVRGPSKLLVFRGDQLSRAFQDCEFAVIAQLPRRPQKYSREEFASSAGQERIVLECVAELRDFFLCAKKYGKNLKRIVHISSAAAVFPVIEPVLHDALTPISRRTLLKEVENLAARADIPLVSLLPSIVIGAPTCPEELSDSHLHLRRLASSWFPLVPKLHYNLVSVLDVADAAALVLEHPAAAGQRYIISDREMSVRDISHVISSKYGGFKKWELPNAATLVLSIGGFLQDYTPVRGLKSFTYLKRNLDRHFRLSNAKSTRDLGLRTRDVRPAIIDSIAPTQWTSSATSAAESSSPWRNASPESCSSTMENQDVVMPSSSYIRPAQEDNHQQQTAPSKWSTHAKRVQFVSSVVVISLAACVVIVGRSKFLLYS